MRAAPPMRALLVDPSLFTAPYDAALTEGLLAAGVEPLWAVRPIRRRDRQEIPVQYVDPFFYRVVDDLQRLPRGLRKMVKGLSHIVGLAQLLRRATVRLPSVIHFQWTVVPSLDMVAMALLRRWCPIVLTVHDTVPFNGERLSTGQNMAYDAPMRVSDRVIVHTESGRQRLVSRGVDPTRVVVVPHGPLRPPEPSPQGRLVAVDGRYTFVMFGEIKPYKGPDVLVEAVALLPPALRRRARFIIAGRPNMDIAPLARRVRELDLDGTVELRPRRLSEEEVSELFAGTDCFLFPYRQVDASGVYFLTKSLQRWIIASQVGIFAEDVQQGSQGALVPPEDPAALADAIAHAVEARPRPTSIAPDRAWLDIGRATRQVYQDARADWAARRPLSRRGARAAASC